MEDNSPRSKTNPTFEPKDQSEVHVGGKCSCVYIKYRCRCGMLKTRRESCGCNLGPLLMSCNCPKSESELSY